ncbi:uncharacterized protein LOC113650130, partial [Tachysurus fulvidraco]|uniref:uncharacterized protein LOC113650130 n=1 Tax=Tachysurus fulvidraco TaxID=1234273 RepID=UPI001FEFB467
KLQGFSFTESSEFLQCFNDYDIELKCSFLAEPSSCSQYKLSATRLNTERLYTCHFIEIHRGECECSLQVKDGFVMYEILVINLLKGDEIYYTTNMKTEESIKPRRPIITSVIQKKNGDFSVNLNTTYPDRKTFLDYMDVELQYGIVGSNVYVTEHVVNVRNPLEIVGRKLQSNSKYIIKARVKSNYPSKMFSDYSEPFVFSTPQSLQNILRIIIPTLCILLIICISSVYFWFNRIIKPWWDKVPMPKFSTNFVKQVPQLLSFQTEFSSLSLDSLANHISKNTCVEIQSEDPYKFYNPSTGKGIETASLTYLLASHQSVNTNGSEHTGFKHQSTNTNQSCRNQQSDELSSGVWKQESGISNKTYLQLGKSSISSIYKQPANQDSSENSEVSSENLQMDFEYYKCGGSTTAGNYKLISVTPPNTERSVDLLDHGIGDVVDHKALSYWNDWKSFNGKKPQDVLFSANDDIVIPMEDGYQAI